MDTQNYLAPIKNEMQKEWPDNRVVNIVCHGHSVPAGYFQAPTVNTFEAYPFMLHQKIKSCYPNAVVNVIVTAIGGEDSSAGAERFETHVLTHLPDVICIDYALNDRRIGLEKAKKSWEKMIESALDKNIKLILLTPTWDTNYLEQNEEWDKLKAHAEQIRKLAEKYDIALVDSFEAFNQSVSSGTDLKNLLSSYNHPSKEGHTLVANLLAEYF